MENKDQITKRIIGCCFKIHKNLGPGFNEKVYHNALKLLFDKEGLPYESEKESGTIVPGGDRGNPFSERIG